MRGENEGEQKRGNGAHALATHHPSRTAALVAVSTCSIVDITLSSLATASLSALTLMIDSYIPINASWIAMIRSSTLPAPALEGVIGRRWPRHALATLASIHELMASNESRR